MPRISVVSASACFLSFSIPQLSYAQCGAIPCAAYPYAPAIAGMAARMGASPGAFGTGVRMGYRQLQANPVRYPPGNWRPYTPPPGYYRFRPAPPGVWNPRW